MAMKKIEVVAQGRENASLQLNACPYKAGSWQANAWTEGWQSWHDDAAVEKKKVVDAAYAEAVNWKPKAIVKIDVQPQRRARDAVRKVEATVKEMARRASFHRDMPRPSLYRVY